MGSAGSGADGGSWRACEGLGVSGHKILAAGIRKSLPTGKKGTPWQPQTRKCTERMFTECILTTKRIYVLFDLKDFL